MNARFNLGRDGILLIPYLNEADSDKLFDLIGNDEVCRAINRTIEQETSTVFKSWLNNLSEREFLQIYSMCLSSSYFEKTRGKVSFTRKEDSVKILSAYIYANIAPWCQYLNPSAEAN